MGEAISAGIIALMVVLSVTFDYLQEHRAELAADRLRWSVVHHDGYQFELWQHVQHGWRSLVSTFFTNVADPSTA